ncbi:MAG: polysaccharide biosynthesis tyrosine autokinase [Burkholderiaceae bacterium]|nr:polysaccharide biosynthesis tyrosine autokinase [Burkholderiaceae bacterium]MEB2317239.1 polysaccharide biosynthesis tyrosine autokinase [Pseudomonadota bacterium]
MSSSRLSPAPEPAPVLPALVANLRLLARRKWLLLGAALFAALVAAAIVFLAIRPTYRAASTLLIESKLATVVEITDVYGRSSSGREYFQTQIETIHSRPVIERVVDQLDLDTHPTFDPRQQQPSGLDRWLTEYGISVGDDKGPPPTAEMIHATVVEQVRQQVSVRPVKLSQLLQISFDAPDPALAAEIANAIAQAYIDTDFETRFSASRIAGDLLDGQIEELRDKVQSSERALQSYLEDKGLLDRDSAAGGGSTLQLSELGRRIVEARERRVEAEQAWRQVAGRNAASAPQVLANPSASAARATLADAERELALASSHYGPAHPSYRTAADRVEVAQQEIQRIIAAVAEGLRREYQSAVATEQALEREEQLIRQSIQGDNRLQIERETLEREVATNRALYQTLLQRRKETDATGQLQTAGARMIEPAIAPRFPIKPNRKLSVGLAFLFGFGIAAGWVLLRGRLDDTIRRRGQVSDELGQALLSAMPTLPKEMLENAGRAITAYPNTTFAESIRDAAAGVLLAGMGEQGQVLIVTSSLPSEGKTTFASNLALSLALNSGKNVLLVEGDLRKPRVADALGLEKRSEGLTRVLDGSADFESAAQRIEGTSLTVIPCGRMPSNPVARLQEHRLGRRLTDWRKQFDIVLIDSPPLQLVSDALLIGRHTDAVIYVVKAGDTPTPLARQGIERLVAAQIRILGVALNHHDFEQAERYYGEYSAQGRYGNAYYGGCADDINPATRLG